MGRKIDDFGVPGQTRGTQGTSPNGFAREGCLLVYHPAVCCVLCAVCCVLCAVCCAVCCVLCAVCCVKVLILDTQMLIFWCLWHAQNVVKI